MPHTLVTHFPSYLLLYVTYYHSPRTMPLSHLPYLHHTSLNHLLFLILLFLPRALPSLPTAGVPPPLPCKPPLLGRRELLHAQHLMDLPEGYQTKSMLGGAGDILPLLVGQLMSSICWLLLTGVQEPRTVRQQDSPSKSFKDSPESISW